MASTPANDLNITQAGYVVFNGTATFTGRTFQAGTGISLTNPDGIAGNTTISLTGGAVAIETINGDSGSISGNTVTIFANNAANNAGSSVKFVNSGTTSTLNLTDAAANTFLGNNAGNLSTTASANTAVGASCLQAVTSGNVNSCFGNSCGIKITTGGGNNAFGTGVLENLTTGNGNLCLGGVAGNSYTTSESNNICLNNVGVIGESNVMRLGVQGSGSNQVNTTFIAGIVGVTASNPVLTTINSSTGQMGVQALTQYDVLVGGASNALAFVGPGTAGQVLQSGGASANPAYSTATYPATASGTGTILRANGTNWVATTTTYPTTNAINTLLYASAANVMSALSTANNGALITNGSGVPSIGTVPIAAGGTNATSMTTSNGIIKYNGTSLVTSTATIDSSNRQTNTSQPCFLARVSGTPSNVTGDGTTYTMLFDTSVFDQNSNYTAGSGTFTAPIAGNYQFNVFISLSGYLVTHTLTQMYWVFTGATYQQNQGALFPLKDSNGNIGFNGTFIKNMAANDTLKIEINVSGGTKVIGVVGSNVYSWFSGSLLC